MPYILLLFISPIVMILFRKKENREKIALASTCIAAFLLLALRSRNSGVDLGAYYDIYQSLRDVTFSEVISDFCFLKRADLVYVEWGYTLFTWIFARFNLGFQTLLIAQSAFCMWSIYHFISKHSEKPSLSIIIIIAFGIVDYCYCILRQAIAFAILLFMTDFIERKKYHIAVLLVIAATFFHQSAIVLLFAVPLSFLPVNWYLTIALIVLSLLIIPLFPALQGIMNRIMTAFSKENYFSVDFEFSELIIVLIAMALFMTFFYAKKKDVRSSDRFAFWVFMMTIPLQTLSMYIPIFARVTTLTMLPFSSVAVTNSFIRKDEKEDGMTIFFEIAITVAVCLYYAFCLYFNKRGLWLIPYRLFFAE